MGYIILKDCASAHVKTINNSAGVTNIIKYDCDRDMTIVIFDPWSPNIRKMIVMSLREKKKIETKNKIFEVAGRLFKEKGFENTTVDEITTKAGIAKGTFFNYFSTKETLLLYFGEQKEELIYGLIEKESTKHIPIKEKIKNILVFVAESCEKDKELTQLLIFESTRYMGHSCFGSDDDICKDRLCRLTEIIYDLLEESAKNGEIKSGIDIKKAAEIISGVHFHSLMVWLKSENDISFSNDISEKIDMLFEGIGH